MARVKLQLPANFLFSTEIPIRISDINYGGHLGNDAVLSIVHEARIQFLQQSRLFGTRYRRNRNHDDRRNHRLFVRRILRRCIDRRSWNRQIFN